jgi:hypothetical protein
MGNHGVFRHFPFVFYWSVEFRKFSELLFEAEFLNVIGTKVLIAFILAIHNPLY